MTEEETGPVTIKYSGHNNGDQVFQCHQHRLGDDTGKDEN